MKTFTLSHGSKLALLALIGMLGTVQAQEPKPAPESDREALAAEFKATLENATFTGHWSVIKDGKPSPARPETYKIQRATHIKDEQWAITARIQYGDKDVSVPIPVQVYWAKDTPIISITDLMIPGLGTYTARVLIYKDAYAGFWSGGEVKGLLNGSITRSKTE
jgi:hypothetical protein